MAIHYWQCFWRSRCVFLPTLFGVFPGLTQVVRPDRIYILVLWSVLALFTALAAETERGEGRARDKYDRRMLGQQYLSLLLKEIEPPYEATIYVRDAKSGLLVPLFPTPWRGFSDPRAFAPGNGATGTAYKTGKVTIVVGEAVSGGQYGLTPEQQALFAPYTLVIAVPISSPPPAEQILGTLSLIARDNDGKYVSGDSAVEEGIRRLEDLADRIGDALPLMG